MKKKRETVQFRIDKELKDQLIRQAEQIGISPSELIRRLIKMGVENDADKINRLEEEERDLRIIAMEIMKSLHRMSMGRNWEEARKNYQDSKLWMILDGELSIRYAKIGRPDLYDKMSDELFGKYKNLY